MVFFLYQYKRLIGAGLEWCWVRRPDSVNLHCELVLSRTLYHYSRLYSYEKLDLGRMSAEELVNCHIVSHYCRCNMHEILLTLSKINWLISYELGQIGFSEKEKCKTSICFLVYFLKTKGFELWIHHGNTSRENEHLGIKYIYTLDVNEYIQSMHDA